eukprot:gene675-3975_t
MAKATIFLAAVALALGVCHCFEVEDGAPEPPTFPIRWQSNEKLLLISGIQKQFASLVSHFDGPNNRTAVTNSTGFYDTLITNWNENGGMGKVYYIRTYGGERHCQFWCPPTVPYVCDAADSLCSYDYENKAKYIGSEVVDGVDTNKFYWTENLGPIPMNSLILYSNANTQQPTPVRLVRFLHPFGKDIGNATIDFTNYQLLDFYPLFLYRHIVVNICIAWHPVSSFPENLFDLGPDAKYYCESPVPDDSCEDEAIKAMQHQAFFIGK